MGYYLKQNFIKQISSKKSDLYLYLFYLIIEYKFHNFE